MLATIATFLGSLVTKEFLISVFKDVFMEVALDLVDEYVADTENPYDDKLAESFREFVERDED